MKSLLKYFIVFVPLISIIFFNNTFSARLILPNTTRQEDTNIDNTQIDGVIANEWTILWYIKTINVHLWFIIWWIALALLMYAWLLLITSWWDKWKVSKAWKIALYTLIGIFVAMLSYAIVNLIVTLV